MDNIQAIFFSKNNITTLNTRLIEKININNLTEQQKKIILDILVKNMKSVWINIDIKKINNNNIKIIFNQFNTYCFNGALKELQEKISKSSSNINDPSKLKFERDFNSNQRKEVIIPTRPQSMGISQSILGSNEPFIMKSKEVQQLANQFDPQIDSLFQPFINTNNETAFNNYNFDKNTNNIRQKLEDVVENRNSELYMAKKPNESDLPPFLQSKPTSIRSSDSNNTNTNNIKQHDTINNKFHNKSNNKSNNKINNNSNNNSNDPNYLHGSNEDETELMSLNNYDYQITNDDTYQEDSTPFQDRLNRLQNDRNNITTSYSNTKVNFEDENFQNTFEDINADLNPTSIDDIKNKKNINISNTDKGANTYNPNLISEQQKLEQYKLEQYKLEQQKLEQYKLEQYKLEQQRLEQYKLEQYKLEQQRLEQQRLEQQSVIISHKLNATEKKEFLKIFKELKKLNNRLADELKKYKSENIDILNKTKLLLEEKDNDNTNKLEDIKTEISNEFSRLNTLKEEYDVKIKEYDIKTEEYNIKTEEFIKKETEYNIILNNYNKISKIKNFILEIGSETSSSYYTYNFNKIDNIISIKLNSYSIPNIIYNIEEDKNNIFEFEIDNITHQIILNSGKYEINNLINFLNKNEHNLIFSLEDISQKVVIKCETKFNIVTTSLSFVNLGFNTNLNLSDKNEYIADILWDLRYDNKIYFFLNNIDNQSPFAILLPNSTSDAEIKLDPPVSLDKLDIIFKDYKGRLCNFNQLSHSINLTLEVM